MKKSILYGLMTSLVVFSSAAYATEPVADDQTSALTTKGYVDAGLKYVYDVASGTSNGAVQNLQNAVGTASVGNTPGTGLIGDVEELQEAVGTAGVGNTPGTGLVGDVEALQDEIGNYTDTDNNIQASGLKGEIETLQDDVDDLKTAVGDATSGLTQKVNQLEAASKEYIEGAGIDITTNAQGKNVVSLDLGTTSSDTTYVYQTDSNGVGSWQALEVESSWSANAFETNVLNGGN